MHGTPTGLVGTARQLRVDIYCVWLQRCSLHGSRTAEEYSAKTWHTWARLIWVHCDAIAGENLLRRIDHRLHRIDIFIDGVIKQLHKIK